MNYKSSSEVQDIFGFSREDIRRLQRAKVIKQPNGQGKATLFDRSDIDRLLDVKMYLLAGFRISDMEDIFDEKYDSYEGIKRQIHKYKKRLLMLEFIQETRESLDKLDNVDVDDIINDTKTVTKNANLPEFGTDDYFEKFWLFLKLIFIMDYMSQPESVESIKVSKKDIVKKGYEVFKIVKEILNYTGTNVKDQELIEVFWDFYESEVEDEFELKKMIKEWATEIIDSKEDIIQELVTQSGLDTMIDKLNPTYADWYKTFLNHLYRFIFEYFIDEEELYYIYINYSKFVHSLDKTDLTKGIIRIGGTDIG